MKLVEEYCSSNRKIGIPLKIGKATSLYKKTYPKLQLNFQDEDMLNTKRPQNRSTLT